MDIAPLWIIAGLGIRQHLRTVEQLGRYLLERWPEASVGTPKHRKAREACLAALEGRGTASAARTTFRRAAEEAGIWGGDAKIGP